MAFIILNIVVLLVLAFVSRRALTNIPKLSLALSAAVEKQKSCQIRISHLDDELYHAKNLLAKAYSHINELETPSKPSENSRFTSIVGEKNIQDKPNFSELPDDKFATLLKLEATIAKQSPDWCRQIDTVIAETDAAVTEAIEGFLGIASRAQQTSNEAQTALTSSEVASFASLTGNAKNIIERFLQHINDTATEIERLATHITDTLKISKSMYKLLDELEKIHNQTNLLSLNASVEAAHAGSKHSGFGVVAQELRKLSLRSDDAAGRLRQMTQELDQHSCVLHGGLKQVVEVCVTHSTHAEDESKSLMTDMQQVNSCTQETVDKLTDLAQSVGAEISRVVTALQFQDLLRQRLEHVAKPIRMLTTNLDGANSRTYTPVCSDSHLIKLETDERNDHHPATKRKVGMPPTLEIVNYNQAPHGVDSDNVTLF